MLYRRGEVNYSKNPYTRTYSYRLSLIRLLLALCWRDYVEQEDKQRQLELDKNCKF